MPRIIGDEGTQLQARCEALAAQWDALYTQACQEVATYGKVFPETRQRLEALTAAHTACVDALEAEYLRAELEVERLRPIMEAHPTMTVKEAYAVLAAQRAPGQAE